MEKLSRRAATNILGVTLASAPLLTAAAAEAVAPPSLAIAPAFAGKHEPIPLPFEPTKLRGLSEKLIASHWENNYIGSVKALNTIEVKLAAALADPGLPPIVYGGLKREESHRTGSVILHEHYFGNLGGDGKAGGDILDALKSAFGSYQAWETEFKRTALSLAGGSGWCILVYNLHTRSLHNHWAWDHMHGAAASLPLLVLDMYEHSFHMDYGAAAAKYIDAFLANVEWEAVERRYARALAMAAK